jgi:hypothetical protein
MAEREPLDPLGNLVWCYERPRSHYPWAKGKGTAHQTGAPFAGRPGLPRSLRVAPFYSQPDRLKPNHSPLHTTAIPTRTVS